MVSEKRAMPSLKINSLALIWLGLSCLIFDIILEVLIVDYSLNFDVSYPSHSFFRSEFLDDDIGAVS